MALRAGLETPGQFCWRWSKFVRLQLLEHLTAPPKNSLMRPEKLVRRAGEEIAADILHIGRDVRRRLHTVDECHGTRRPCLRANRLNVVECPGKIARTAHTNQPRALRNNLIQSITVELKSFLVERQPANFKFKVSSQQDPWPDVGVVIHPRYNNLVARSQQAAD